MLPVYNSSVIGRTFFNGILSTLLLGSALAFTFVSIADAALQSADPSVLNSTDRMRVGGCAQDPYPTLRSRYLKSDAAGINQINRGFACCLARFLDANPSVRIKSGYRSVERQAQLYAAAVAKYGSSDAARKWVAPAGGSMHNKGLAADLSNLPSNAKQQAARLGLTFRMDHEPWHIEPGDASCGENVGGNPTGNLPAGSSSGNPLSGSSAGALGGASTGGGSSGSAPEGSGSDGSTPPNTPASDNRTLQNALQEPTTPLKEEEPKKGGDDAYGKIQAIADEKKTDSPKDPSKKPALVNTDELKDAKHLSPSTKTGNPSQVVVKNPGMGAQNTFDGQTSGSNAPTPSKFQKITQQLKSLATPMSHTTSQTVIE